MTITEIKDKMPDVPIKINGVIYQGRLSGSKCQFPKVHKRLDNGDWVSFEFTWSAIQSAINNNTYLKV